MLGFCGSRVAAAAPLLTFACVIPLWAQLILRKAGDAEATQRDSRERSPLIYAMEGGSKEVVELLLSAHAPTSLPAHTGIASRLSRQQRAIIRCTPVRPPVSHARELRLTASLRPVSPPARAPAGKGAKLSENAEYGRTPLMVAAAFGHSKLVAWLITEARCCGRAGVR